VLLGFCCIVFCLQFRVAEGTALFEPGQELGQSEPEPAFQGNGLFPVEFADHVPAETFFEGINAQQTDIGGAGGTSRQSRSKEFRGLGSN